MYMGWKLFMNAWQNTLQPNRQQCAMQLFSEAVEIVQLMLLVVSATAAAAEHILNSLHRLRRWLRQTMTQERLTHPALLHCQRQRLKKIDIDSLCEEFVIKTPFETWTPLGVSRLCSLLGQTVNIVIHSKYFTKLN